MSGRIQGRVAVVTGGSSGIGLATAALFAQEGARVFVTGRHAEELAAAASRLGPGVIPVAGDVTKNGDLERLYETVKRQAGQIDILFANAGVGSSLRWALSRRRWLTRSST